MNNAPFSIGQKVVAVVTHSQGAFKKGDEFSVIRNRLFETTWLIDVGLKSWANRIDIGKFLVELEDNTWWFSPTAFAPIETNYADATAEILEKFKQTNEQPDKVIIPEPINQ